MQMFSSLARFSALPSGVLAIDRADLRHIVVPEAKDLFRRQDEIFAARSAQGILKCRLAL